MLEPEKIEKVVEIIKAKPETIVFDWHENKLYMGVAMKEKGFLLIEIPKYYYDEIPNRDSVTLKKPFLDLLARWFNIAVEVIDYKIEGDNAIVTVRARDIHRHVDEIGIAARRWYEDKKTGKKYPEPNDSLLKRAKTIATKRAIASFIGIPLNIKKETIDKRLFERK